MACLASAGLADQLFQPRASPCLCRSRPSSKPFDEGVHPRVEFEKSIRFFNTTITCRPTAEDLLLGRFEIGTQSSDRHHIDREDQAAGSLPKSGGAMGQPECPSKRTWPEYALTSLFDPKRTPLVPTVRGFLPEAALIEVNHSSGVRMRPGENK